MHSGFVVTSNAISGNCVPESIRGSDGANTASSVCPPFTIFAFDLLFQWVYRFQPLAATELACWDAFVLYDWVKVRHPRVSEVSLIGSHGAQGVHRLCLFVAKGLCLLVAIYFSRASR